MRINHLYLLIFCYIGIVNGSALELHTVCINKNVALVHLSFESDKFDLSSDAVVDNAGGYVDIPSQNYYLKTPIKVYRIQGDVVAQENKQNHLFKGVLTNSTDSLEDLEQLKNINDNKIKIIQKIDLASNNKISFQTITTTNIQEVSIDIETLKKEFSKCSK